METLTNDAVTSIAARYPEKRFLWVTTQVTTRFERKRQYISRIRATVRATLRCGFRLERPESGLGMWGGGLNRV